MKSIKAILCFVLCLTATMANAGRVSHKKTQLFDAGWKFQLGDVDNAQAPEFDDNSWRTLDLPHDWSIEGAPEQKNPMGGAGGYFPAGVGWYRKKFDVPASWQEQCVSVYFEGVYMNSEVFINGHSLGIYPYGYSSFAYRLEKYLKFGEKNTLAVKVDNSQQINCRWYSGSGIYRHVWMQVTHPVHVAPWGLNVNTVSVDKGRATVRVTTLLKNETPEDCDLSVLTQIASDKNKSVGDKLERIRIAANSEKELLQYIQLDNVDLWSPEQPSMYRASVRVVSKGMVLEHVTAPFGIRTIDYSADKGFLLNGISIKLNGGCVHHDHGCLGAASFDRAEERKVNLLKQAGFNAVRTSHNPPSEAFLNYCDRIGLLVIDEAFDGWRTEKNKNDYARFFDARAKQDVQAMVMRDRNHPSVIMWSIGNEIIERTKPEAVQTARKLAGWVKEMDTTRPVTSAMTTWNQGWAVFDSLMAAHDICGYNYQLHEAPADHARVPSRVIVQTESYPREAFKNYQAVQSQTYVVGDFVWTALDYLGESGIGRCYYPGEPKGEHWESDLFPWHGAYCGDIDLTGIRKPISHYRNMLWNDTEKLYMAVKEPNPSSGPIKETMWSVWPSHESWTWPGMEGKPLDVEVFSKYPSIRLYVNNQLVAEKETNLSTEYKTTIPVNYKAGELKVVGIGANGKAETVVLKTASKASQISLKPDKRGLTADGQDLIYIQVQLNDKNGLLNPTASNPLRVQVNGAATLLAVDNATLRDTRAYPSTDCHAANGRALIVIRSTHKAGPVRVQVTSDGLKPSQILLNAK